MKLQNKTLSTILEIATHIGFGVWGVMACFFFQERLYGDEGFFIAKVVHYESFWVELNRYARVFSQWLPLLAIKAKFSMHTVLILFSLCQVLFFYIVFLWARYRQSNHQAGWMLLAMNTIGIAYCFSTQGFELYYCAALLVVLYLLLPKNDNSKKTIYLVVLTSFIILNYQLVILPLLGILLLHSSDHKTGFWKTYLVILASAICTFFFKKIFFVYSYETEKANFFIQNFLNWSYDGSFFKELGFFLWKFYFELFIVQLITILVYTKQKKWILLFGYIIFVLFALLVAILTFPSLSHTQYQEQCYFILIFITSQKSQLIQ